VIPLEEEANKTVFHLPVASYLEKRASRALNFRNQPPPPPEPMKNPRNVPGTGKIQKNFRNNMLGRAPFIFLRCTFASSSDPSFVTMAIIAPKFDLEVYLQRDLVCKDTGSRIVRLPAIRPAGNSFLSG
jgi:hypothetical protein